jgi:hypothetical protein
MLVWYLFFYRKHTSIKPVDFDYSAIDGNDRKAVIAAFDHAKDLRSKIS